MQTRWSKESVNEVLASPGLRGASENGASHQEAGAARLEEVVKSAWCLHLQAGDITKVRAVHVAIYGSETEGQRRSMNNNCEM